MGFMDWIDLAWNSGRLQSVIHAVNVSCSIKCGEFLYYLRTG